MRKHQNNIVRVKRVSIANNHVDTTRVSQIEIGKLSRKKIFKFEKLFPALCTEKTRIRFPFKLNEI